MNKEIEERTNKKLAQNEELGRHTVVINKRQYVVSEGGVFSPDVFIGTQWLTNRMIENFRGDRFLEIGVGCGCAIIELLLSGKCKQAVGCDINVQAVKNTQENMKRHGVEAQVIVSDVFNSLPKDMKFSTIYWNYPFHPSQKSNNEMSMLERSVRDHNYEGMNTLLKDLENRLEANGIVLIGFSRTMGNVPLLRSMVEQFSYNIQDICSMEAEGKIMCLFGITFKPLN